MPSDVTLSTHLQIVGGQMYVAGENPGFYEFNHMTKVESNSSQWSANWHLNLKGAIKPLHAWRTLSTHSPAPDIRSFTMPALLNAKIFFEQPAKSFKRVPNVKLQNGDLVCQLKQSCM